MVLGLLVSLLSVPASAFEEIDVDARAALLVEKETGEILYEKNAHEKNYPASITKLTVALLVFEAIDAGQLSLDQPITAHESAFEGLSIYGSTAGIKVGEVLTVEQLLQCMLIVSANEACNILAEAVCGEGNISQFVQRMNERAAALGCENTHYVNTSGLHDPDHYTTAWDIYLITRALMPYEKFMEICNSKSAEIAETDHNQRHVLHSTNRLISNWRELGYLYRDAQGIKTGSTEEAGHCLVSSAVRGDRQLVSVVLGAERSPLPTARAPSPRAFPRPSASLTMALTASPAARSSPPMSWYARSRSPFRARRTTSSPTPPRASRGCCPRSWTSVSSRATSRCRTAWTPPLPPATSWAK